MRHIVIDTKTGKYGVVKSREKVESFTEGKVTKNILWNLFTFSRDKREKKQTYVDDRFIILPYKTEDEIYQDKELIGKLISYR